MPKIQFSEEFRQEAIRQIIGQICRILCQTVKVRYALIAREELNHAVRTLCKVMNANRSGNYAWQVNPELTRQKQETKFLGLIKQS